MRSYLISAAMCVAFTALSAHGKDVQSAQGMPAFIFHPMLRNTTADPGYFVDPYPAYVSVNGTTHPDFRWFSGTTRQILTCMGPLEEGCFQRKPVSIDTGKLASQAMLAGKGIGTHDNANIYKDGSGHWQMAFTLYVQDPAAQGAKGHWTIIAHARPALDTRDVPPMDWIADSVLVGSFDKPVRGNYDGKYFEDNGQLYLVYSKRLSNGPARDGIVAQAMVRPDKPGNTWPTVLLAPADQSGGFNSELFHPDEPKDHFKLVETGNVTKIGSTYVMAYSTGAYNRPAYKAGVAFSDTFLPIAGSMYRKVFMVDTQGVWGVKNRLEVHYLLQGAKEQWPNYTGKQILAPGVPSIVNDGHGNWSMFFAGYAVGDAPHKSGSKDFDGSHRRPYFLPLDVNIPPGAKVEGVPDKALMDWITPSRK